jgi:hypothetical protein
MNNILGSVVVAALIPAALAFGNRRPAVVVKCAEVTGPPAYVIDGRVFPMDTDADSLVVDGKAMTAEQIDSLSVECSREFHRVFGVHPGRDLVVVWTKAVPSAELKMSVQSIVPLQEAYFTRRGVFAAGLADLSWRDPSGSITVRLCVTEDGQRWAALGWQTLPRENPPRVLVIGASMSASAVYHEQRYSCQATPAEGKAVATPGAATPGLGAA